MGITHWLKWGAAAAATGLACGAALAQEQARVLSSVPVLQQVGIPQQVCSDDTVYSGQRTSGAGAVIGALIGGVAGNALGHGSHYGRGGYYHGSNRGATTAIGAVAGGLIGNQVEGVNGGTPAYQTVRRCNNETVYENRTVGYDVTYEYAGRRYTTRMDRDPGRWVPVSVQPTGSYHSAGAQPSGTYVGPSGVYSSAPAGVTVTESITYESPQSTMPIVVDVNAGGPYPAYPGYPPYTPPPQWQRPPPPPGYWR